MPKRNGAIALGDRTERSESMERVTFNKETTALLVIDLYNDFISEGGKL